MANYKRLLDVLLAGIVIVFLAAFGGLIEGKMFPVVKNTHLYDVRTIDGKSTRIWGNAEKLRDCTFSQLIWNLGRPGRSAEVNVYFEESSKIREDGMFHFGPWVVDIASEDIMDDSYAQVFHRCHPFWRTETRFYP